MKSAILIITNTLDESVCAVTSILDSRGAPYFRFDTDRLHEDATIEMLQDESGCLARIRDHVLKSGITSEDVRAVWYRRPRPHYRRTKYHEGISAFIGLETAVSLSSLYSILDDVLWMNPMHATRKLEGNKLLQCEIARTLGMQTPRTCISSDPGRLATFCRSNGGRIIVKLLQGASFMSEQSGEQLMIFSTPLTESDIENRKDAIRLCPVLAQEYVPKRVELRSYVVGGKVMTAAIHSQQSEYTMHDWRNYDPGNVPHEQWSLPDDLSEMLLRFCKREGLLYGAFDFILTPDDKYVFLEVNPSGQWEWIEKLTGLQISEAIASTLSSSMSS